MLDLVGTWMPEPSRCLIAAILFLSGISAGQAIAASSDWFRSTELEARLITSVDSVAVDQATLQAGLQLKLADGWKTYWRTPGEVGMPPELSWQGAVNVADAEMAWPAPSRFTAFEIENYGYAGEVVLPVRLRLDKAGGAAGLRADANVLVCEQLCIPMAFSLDLQLPKGDGAIDPDAAQLINQFSARVPDDGRLSGLALETVHIADDQLIVTANAEAPITAADIFVESAAPHTLGPPQTILTANGRTFQASFALTSGSLVAGEDVTVTMVADDRAATFGPQALLAGSPARALVGQPAVGASLGWFVLLALLGGLILNIMPCVLPVLSIKLGAALVHREQALSSVRRSFLVTAAGIVASMMVIALVTLLARELGAVVGWGIHFQNPYFLAFMVMVTGLFAANLGDLFTIQLPGAASTALAEAGDHSGWQGDFLTGAFATLLATPCSAPFLGTAVGFALSHGALEVLVIFAALGLGLALPYLAVALVPKTVRALPRPGRWMSVVRWFLAAALAGTAIWLASVLAAITGWANAGLVLAAVAAFIVLASTSPRNQTLAWSARAVMAALALLIVSSPAFSSRQQVETEASSAAGWQPFVEAGIADFVADGQTVLVDVTADWCITCKANKSLVLDRAPTAERLAEPDIVLMRADWTKPNDDIARFLQRHGRYGIPFNIIYGPAAPQGIALPELLTEEAVNEALDAAAG